MKVKQLKSIQDDISRLEKLGNEIREISDYAKGIQDKTLDIRLSLNYGVADSEAEKVRFDEDGSIVHYDISDRMPALLFGGFMRNHVTGIRGGCNSKNHSFGIDLSEVAVLQVLGVIISFKESERMFIVNRLMALGIEL